MNELQSKLLDILKYFHHVCEENGLDYYVLGGTMLGAVRHNGFIPWDDDIDVGLPRKDYDKLAVLLNESGKENEKYKFEKPLQNNDFIYPYCKLYDTTTTLVENAKKKIKRGIYIDIFPLDGIGNTYEESCKNYKEIKRLNNLRLLKCAGYRKGRKIYKNLGIFLFRVMPINSKKILKRLVLKCSEKNYDRCDYIGNLVGAWGIKEIVRKEVMGEPKLYKFENINVYGAEDFDGYLTSLYGDWRKLPPKEKQVSRHDFIELDLGKSFLE